MRVTKVEFDTKDLCGFTWSSKTTDHSDSNDMSWFLNAAVNHVILQLIWEQVHFRTHRREIRDNNSPQSDDIMKPHYKVINKFPIRSVLVCPSEASCNYTAVSLLSERLQPCGRRRRRSRPAARHAANRMMLSSFHGSLTCFMFNASLCRSLCLWWRCDRSLGSDNWLCW